MQTQPEEQQNKWQEIQDSLAERAGLSILIVEGHQPPALSISNNNSICRVVQSSESHAERCEPFCGAAFQNVMQEGNAINYRCHAGLYCVAAPLETGEKPLVAIVGRGFLKSNDYRDLTDRVFDGDWINLPTEELFENVNIASSLADLEQLAERLQNLKEDEKSALTVLTSLPKSISNDETTVLTETEPNTEKQTEVKNEDILEIDFLDSFPDENEPSEVLLLDEEAVSDELNASPKTEQSISSALGATTSDNLFDLSSNDFQEWRDYLKRTFAKDYEKAIVSTLDFIADKFDITNLAWLRRNQNRFKPLKIKGELRGDLWQTGLNVNDESLRHAVEQQTSLKLENKISGKIIELFAVPEQTDAINSVIVVANEIKNDGVRRGFSDFITKISLHLEVLRLREEVEKRAKLEAAIKKFNSELQTADSEDFLDTLVNNSVELVGATRGSLLFFDEASQSLRPAAAKGTRAEEIKNESHTLGERIAFRVWTDKTPILATNLETLNLPPAPVERNYLSKSFVSLPLNIGGKRIGVLNVTDKRDESLFDEDDLRLLEAVAPQLAIALDRAALHQKAGEFEAASITDALTELLNRRYLEARLEEEVRRSQRHGYPLSFMMIDVDYFKRYNDNFGHQAGDEALRVVAQCLKAALRSADIAARYGGEEFSILLPQTTQTEARAIAERIRRRVETTNFVHGNITISIGIASFSPQLETPAAVIEAADRALYDAKRAGRNTVQIYANGNGSAAVLTNELQQNYA